METWLPMVRELGFPIVVTLYLLVRIEGKLEGLTHSISELSRILDRKDS